MQQHGWMESIMLSEINQLEKDKHHFIFQWSISISAFLRNLSWCCTQWNATKMKCEGCMKSIDGGDYDLCEAQFICFYEIVALIVFWEYHYLPSLKKSMNNYFSETNKRNGLGGRKTFSQHVTCDLNSQQKYTINEPWPVWLTWLGVVLQSKRFNSWSGHQGVCKRQPISVSLPLCLSPLPLSKNQ